jgi:hypothetical protein
MRPKSKAERLKPLRAACPEIDQRPAAHARCSCRVAAIIFDAKMRLDDWAAVRLTGAHGQTGFKEEASCRG